MFEIEMKHSDVLSEYFSTQEEFDKKENEIEKYRKIWNEVVEALKAENLLILRGYKYNTFVPYIQYFTLDALPQNLWPNNISANSIFIAFQVNLKEKTVKPDHCGHIYLTEADQKKSYLCMCSMKDAHKANHGVWLRKSKYKTANDLAKKITKFWDSVYCSLEAVTTGYPFKQMDVNIY